jgi:hypothetical protein
MDSFSRGAEGWTAARRQNSAGKSLLSSHPLDFRKGTRTHGLQPRKCVQTQSYRDMQGKFPVGIGGTSAYFGDAQRSDPRLLRRDSKFPILFPRRNINTNAINFFTFHFKPGGHGYFTPSQPSPLEGEGKGGGDMPIYLLRLY